MADDVTYEPSLGQQFIRAAVVRKDTDVIESLLRVIKHAVGTFHLGPYMFYFEEAGGSLGANGVRKLIVEPQRHPMYRFTYMLDTYSLGLAYDPHAYLFETLREPLFNHFRYRPGIEPDDHIILGEE